jgi:Na+/H+ antiporter NhaD/arsenite permease-like protein
LIAFILGINLGGNILPQGSAADMMTLELSKKYCADDLNYKRLLKVGGLFAIYHIILGIGYLAIVIFLFF